HCQISMCPNPKLRNGYQFLGRLKQSRTNSALAKPRINRQFRARTIWTVINLAISNYFAAAKVVVEPVETTTPTMSNVE
ncbi:MAG: hypothetical protein FWG25_02145, partial [Promicromonosporaceae bacterium]|nr:hypothetical protein [Promicromonosporaceae bacterium]